MGDPRGFLNIDRKEGGYRPVEDRVCDFGEVEQTLDVKDRRAQASRCMDCGVPFCHWACPLDNKMPEWQDSLYKGDFADAYKVLAETNAFPEFTGRVCPAPCEKSCVLAIHDVAVTCRENECATSSLAFEKGLVEAKPPLKRTKKKIAVVGSGPAGLTAAYWLNQLGHNVTVYEQDDAVGGLLRYGIPDFKLGKSVIDRRVAILMAEGIKFVLNCKVGVDITAEKLDKDNDAILLACGSMVPRDLPIEGRDLKGVNFAMDFLKEQNKVVAGLDIDPKSRLNTKGKSVLVIGGGDTGSDCVGTSNRQKAASITQIEIMPKPSTERDLDNPWPYWPTVLRTSSSHKEGCERRWGLATKRFIGENGVLKQTEVVQVEWTKDDSGRFKMSEIEGTNEIIDTDYVFLSMGFTNPVHEGLLDTLGVEYDERGNVKSDSYASSKDKVFVAGDVTTGASLVVTAMQGGRDSASVIDQYLTKKK